MAPLDPIQAPLADAFDDCVDRLRAGYSLDECLRAYPQHAARLRALLETALAVQHANPGVPASARARVRERVMQSAVQRQPRRSAALGQRRTLLAAAALLIVLFAAVLVALLSSNEDHALHVVSLAAESASATFAPSMTPSWTVTPTPSATPTWMPALPPVSGRPTGLPTGSPATTAPACRFTIQANSVNLRSGPGTGYGVAAYGFSGDSFPVVAMHPSREWLKVQADPNQASWVAASVGALSGDCADVPLLDLPLKEGGGTGTGGQGGDITPVPGVTATETGGNGSGQDGGDGHNGSGQSTPEESGDHGTDSSQDSATEKPND